MRLLHTAQVYPRTQDDAMAPFMHEAARALAATERVDRLDLLVPHDAGLLTEERRDDVHIHRFRYARNDAAEDLAYHGDMHRQVLGSPVGALRFLAFLARWRTALRAHLRHHRPDLVHVHWWVPSGLVASRVCRAARVPYVVSCHGTDVALLAKHRWAARLAARVFRHAAAVHVVSNAMVDILRDTLPPAAWQAVADKTHVFPMPIARELFDIAAVTPTDTSGVEAGEAQPPAGRSVRMLFVGRLVPVKGLDILLEALARVKAALPHDAQVPHLVVVGDGPMRAEWEHQAEALDLLPHVAFQGAVGPNELLRLYRGTDLLVMPSVDTPAGEREGLGLVALEAMAAGVPVVASTSGGLRDVVLDGVTGTTFTAGDPAPLASIIRRFMVDREVFTRMVPDAREHARRMVGPGRFTEELLKLYDVALEGRS